MSVGKFLDQLPLSKSIYKEDISSVTIVKTLISNNAQSIVLIKLMVFNVSFQTIQS